MKYKLLLIFLFGITLIGCDREKIVDKDKLTGFDYRLFQQTPAWEFAKAVQDGKREKIKEIVRNDPALINYQEPKYGSTLLMLTIRNDNKKSFKTLLEEGADVNIYDTFSGRSALIEAGSFGNVSYAELLLSHGADVNDVEVGDRKPTNSTRDTPLIAAARSGNCKMVKFLISKGANINYQNEYGQSALSVAALTNEFDIVLYLLQNGADYHRTLFYRQNYSCPAELYDYNDKNPVYFKEFLLEPHHQDDIVTKYKLKKILKFLDSNE